MYCELYADSISLCLLITFIARTFSPCLTRYTFPKDPIPITYGNYIRDCYLFDFERGETYALRVHWVAKHVQLVPKEKFVLNELIAINYYSGAG